MALRDWEVGGEDEWVGGVLGELAYLLIKGVVHAYRR